MRSFAARWPHVAARRTYGVDGRPIWEFRFTPRALLAEQAAQIESGPDRGQPVGPDRGAPAAQDGPARSRPVSNWAVHRDGDLLRVDEFQALRERPEVDFGQLVDRTDVALALIELGADPDDEVLRRRVTSGLAMARGWLHQPPELEICSARIHGEGVGAVLTGVFIWQASSADAVFSYLVTPGPEARDVLKSDPDLMRALLRCACPRPDDAHGDLRTLLQEALARLDLPAETASGRGAPAMTACPVDAPVVLEIRAGESATSMPPARPAPAAIPDKSESERALSDELAQLARKVGTAAVRSSTQLPRQAS